MDIYKICKQINLFNRRPISVWCSLLPFRHLFHFIFNFGIVYQYHLFVGLYVYCYIPYYVAFFNWVLLSLPYVFMDCRFQCLQATQRLPLCRCGTKPINRIRLLNDGVWPLKCEMSECEFLLLYNVGIQLKSYNILIDTNVFIIIHK